MINKHQAQVDFYDYCQQWKLAPWIFVQMQRNNLIGNLYDNVRLKFSNTYERVKTENELRYAEAERFLKLFHSQGIEVAILKGNLLMHSVYAETGYKKMNDFDMLIHPGDWPKVLQIYHDLNYIPLGNGWSGEKAKAAKFSHAGLSFISANYHCITGTQWGLKSPTSKYRVDIENLWASTSDFGFRDIQAKQLSPEYNVLHLILHMGIYKCGIRDCMDIYNILLKEENIDFDKLNNIIYNSGANNKAWFTMQLTNICSGAVEPAFLKALTPKNSDFITRRLDARLKMADKSGDMQHSNNDHFHHIEMIVFYFGLFNVFHKKLYFFVKLVRQMFFPPKSLAFKLSDLSENPTLWQKVRAVIKAPYNVFALTGEEIGTKITFILFFKLMIDTLLSVRFYFIRKETYFEYLRRRNIDIAEITRIVKGIE
ncbi:MAG: nucleotidyltransferase family protein [Bacteroidales bacterium]|nr:nucleotidyltransferase family protein [Bacteroidales bacterium]